MKYLPAKMGVLLLALFLVACSPSSSEDAVATYVVQTVEAATNLPALINGAENDLPVADTAPEVNQDEATNPSDAPQIISSVTKDDAANFDGLVRFLPVDPNSILPIDFVIWQSHHGEVDGWVRGGMLISLINFHTEPLNPMSISIYSGHVETEEGVSYESETMCFDSCGDFPVTIEIDPLAGQPLPVLLPLVSEVLINYKFAAAATPTRFVLSTSLGDIYINIPSLDENSYFSEQDVFSYAPQQTNPLGELMDKFVFEVSGSEQVQFTIDKTCVVEQKKEFAFKFILTNNNPLNEETVFLSISHPIYYYFSVSHDSVYAYWWHVEDDLQEKFKIDYTTTNLEKGGDLPITVGPGQTIEGSYIMTPAGKYDFFYGLPQDNNGAYNLYQPLLCAE